MAKQKQQQSTATEVDPERKLDSTEETYLARINDWQNKKGWPVLTPELGEIVLWYRGAIATDEMAVPAICNGIERPGVIVLDTFRPQSTVSWKNGVQFDAMLKPSDRMSQMTQERGTWTLKKSAKIEQRHRQPWIDYCQSNIEVNEDALEKYRVDRAEREAKHKALMNPNPQPERVSSQGSRFEPADLPPLE